MLEGETCWRSEISGHPLSLCERLVRMSRVDERSNLLFFSTIYRRNLSSDVSARCSRDTETSEDRFLLKSRRRLITLSSSADSTEKCPYMSSVVTKASKLLFSASLP